MLIITILNSEVYFLTNNKELFYVIPFTFLSKYWRKTPDLKGAPEKSINYITKFLITHKN